MIIHPDAENELNAAIDYYESCEEGLGISLLYEVEMAFTKISENPFTWGVFHKNFHRYLVHRFPFAVIYIIENEQLFIIAIAHTRRKPFYWKSRLG